MERELKIPERGFNELLLGGVLLLMLTLAGLGLGLYVLPSEHLSIPEIQPVIRISEESAFPVGGSRVQNWGERVILVVRAGEAEYYALEGTSPIDGCILRWDPESVRVFSPCKYIEFDLLGDVVAGLAREPLQSYAVYVRDGVVYVGAG